MERKKVVDFIRNEFGVREEHLWLAFPGYAVFRNAGNGKWFAVVMDVERKRLGLEGEGRADVIDLRCDPVLIGSLLRKKGYLPAYHMSKKSWVTALLDGSADEEELKDLIRLSYELVSRKGDRKRRGAACRKPAEEPDAGLELHVPRREEGWFYVKMMTDPRTMSYNAPWFPPDGCIPDAGGEWERLWDGWIGREPERFYAFLRRKEDGRFVGDVNYHFNAECGWHDMGIVIHAPERGKGYGKQGLRLLLDRAFRTDGISRLHNEFETARGAAYRIHLDAGFREAGKENGCVRLEMTREEYFSKYGPDGKAEE